MFWAMCFFGVFFVVVALVIWAACATPDIEEFTAACDCCCHWQPDDDVPVWGTCFFNPDRLEVTVCSDHCPEFARGRLKQKTAENGSKQ